MAVGRASTLKTLSDDYQKVGDSITAVDKMFRAFAAAGAGPLGDYHVEMRMR